MRGASLLCIFVLACGDKEAAPQAGSATPRVAPPQPEMIYFPGGDLIARRKRCIEGTRTLAADILAPKDVAARVEAFYIDRQPTSCADYARCQRAGACPRFDAFAVCRDGGVQGAALELARTYCAWRNARLPTLLEWQRAARGAQGRIYPWGNEAHTDLRCRATRTPMIIDGEAADRRCAFESPEGFEYGLDNAADELVADTDCMWPKTIPPTDNRGGEIGQVVIDTSGFALNHVEVYNVEVVPEFRCARSAQP